MDRVQASLEARCVTARRNVKSNPKTLVCFELHIAQALVQLATVRSQSPHYAATFQRKNLCELANFHREKEDYHQVLKVWPMCSVRYSKLMSESPPPALPRPGGVFRLRGPICFRDQPPDY